ncbi:hypothetical protein V1289_003709 [Bradyrhizobium sp. AZCC 2289]
MLAAHSDTSAFGPLPAFCSPGLDKFAFELRQTAKDRQHQPTGSSCRIRPLLPEGLERRPMVSNGL